MNKEEVAKGDRMGTLMFYVSLMISQFLIWMSY